MSDDHPSRLVGKDDAFVISTLDGSNTIFSKSFNASYHSLNGAVSESRHVFIEHGLKMLTQDGIFILEMGFGTGLNAFLSFLFSEKNNIDINYTGLELHPINGALAHELNYPSYLASAQWSDVFFKMHERNSFNQNHFHFRKVETLDQLDPSQKFDCIFFDAFAPSVQPELWEEKVFTHIYSLTKAGGYLVTYCAKGEVRRRLIRAGFEVKRLPGAPGKKEMIQAFKTS